MRFLKGLLVVFLFIIIIGGLGFLGYSLFMGNMSFSKMNMSSDQKMSSGQESTNMPGKDTAVTSDTKNDNLLPGSYNSQNREKLTNAINLINDAVELITIDPYSQITVSNNSMNMNRTQGNASQTNGSINIYPSDNSSVNITPGSSQTGPDLAGITDNTQNNMNMPDINMAGNQPNNTVYDQAKLQQIHNGIYTLAEGILTINELNNNLMTQSLTLEENPYTYQTYVNRYNNASRNKKDLDKATQMLKQAFVLVNINPYTSENGYQYNTDSMKQLHQGIYKLAQGMSMLESLGDDFIYQMSTAYTEAQSAVSYSGQMNMDSMQTGLFGNINMKTLLNIVIVILVVGLVTGIIGTISSLFRTRSNLNG
jgi:hypothetical protein